MDKRLYRMLVGTAILLTMLWVAWAAYDNFFLHRSPGEMAYHAANKLFEDGNYSAALAEYETAFNTNHQLLDALRGQARSLMQLGRNEEAMERFNRAIEQNPELAVTYANRGILHDRMGHYQLAIADYDKALSLDSKIAEGPNWLTRFLRLQTEKPPGIAERARYLREQLVKPESERVLRMPEIDAQQRPYKM